MKPNHVIKKVVLELHADSRQQIGEVEESFRQILYSVIIPAIEKYCDGIQQSGFVVRLDKLELDLGNVNIPSLKNDVQKGIDVFLARDPGITVEDGDVIKPELSACKSLVYFMDTGLLPWHIQGNRQKIISLLFDDAVTDSKMNAAEILRFAASRPSALRRLLAYVDDHRLWTAAMTMCPQHDRQFLQAGNLLLRYCGRRLQKERRIFLWRTLIYFLSDGNIKPEILLNQFVEIYAAACHVRVSKLRDDILGAVDAGDVSGKDSIVVLLKAVRQFSGDEKLSAALMESEFYHLHELYERKLDVSPSNNPWLIGIQKDLVAIMFEYAHSFSEMVQRTIKERLLESLTLSFANSASGVPEALRDMLRQELGTIGAYSRSIQILLSKVDAYGKDRHPVVQTIGNLLNHSHRLHTSSQFFLFLDRVEQVITALPDSVYEADIGIWLQDIKRELLRQRISGSVKNDFMQLLGDVKRLCEAEDQNAVSKFLRKLLDLFSLIITHDKITAFRQILNQIDTALQLPEAAVNKGVILESIASMAAKDVKTPLDNNAGEIYVTNAGLVLLAPFLKELFSGTGLVVDNNFKDSESRFSAMALLHHLVWPDENWREYDAALIKILCGIEIAAECNPYELDESVKLHAEQLLKEFLHTEQVFRNVSPEGFRNAFLIRDGVLKLHGNHAILMVNRETFDVVLDKVGWDFHLIRYPWMKFPLMIEW